MREKRYTRKRKERDDEETERIGGKIGWRKREE